MGTGKTKQTIAHLKSYLSDKFQQTIEVYVPRHDLADEWEQSLEGINAKVIHVYPRTGGKWDEEQNSYPNPIRRNRPPRLKLILSDSALVRAEDLPRYGVRAENERTASQPGG